MKGEGVDPSPKNHNDGGIHWGTKAHPYKRSGKGGFGGKEKKLKVAVSEKTEGEKSHRVEGANWSYQKLGHRGETGGGEKK